MKCTTAQELLYDYVEGRLDAQTGRAVSEHLQACPDCAHEAREWRKVHLLFTRTPQPRPPEQFVRQTVQAVRCHYPDGRSRTGTTAVLDLSGRSFLYNETVRNAVASIAAAIILVLISDVLLFGRADTFLAGQMPEPAGVFGATGNVISGVFIKLGGMLDSAFGFLMRLSDIALQPW
jgi:anti-sigma factor RsiW